MAGGGLLRAFCGCLWGGKLWGGGGVLPLAASQATHPPRPAPNQQAMGGVYSVLNQKRGMVFEEMQRPGEGGPCAREACCMTAAMVWAWGSGWRWTVDKARAAPRRVMVLFFGRKL